MTKSVEISVIVPVYNVEDYIVECLDSIMFQDIDCQMEIVVVDDCGTDNSIYLAEQYQKLNSKQGREIHIIHHEHNLGLSAARNTGIRHSSGKYLYFIDSDDLLFDKNSLNSLYHRMLLTHADFVVGERCVWDGEKISKGTEMLYLKGHDSIDSNDKVMASYMKRWTMVAWNKLLDRRLIVDNALYFPENIYFEDNYWAFNLMLKTKHIEIIPDITYKYRLRSGSITYSFNMKHYKDIIHIIEMMYNKITSEGLLYQYNPELLTMIYESNRFGLTKRALANTNLRDAKALFRTMQNYGLTSFFNILTSKTLTTKDKRRIIPFYIGGIGFYMRYFKFLIKNKQKTLRQNG